MTVQMPTNLRFIEQERQPWVTYGLLVLLAVIFVGEWFFGVTGRSFSPSTPTLIALGGLNRTVIVTQGEWYRLFTPALLHANFGHLFFNWIALFFAGIFLERLVGHMWFFALFTLGALGGTLMSLAVNDPVATSVGASGAIMGLFGAMYTCSFRLPQGPQRRRLQAESIRILVPSMLPFFASAGEHVDYGAHTGGVLMGIMAGMVLLAYWPEDERWPDLREFAALITLAGVVLFSVSAGAVMIYYSKYKTALAGMIPETAMPKTPQERLDMSSELIAHYPRDPRSHLYRAQSMLAHHDTAGAKREMTTALTEEDKVRFMFGAKLENLLHADIALLWLSEGHRDEARAAFKPVCAASSADRPPGQIYDMLIAKRLCD